MKPAALGFAPHSGWAAVVALGGPGPELLHRGRLEMTDGALPGAAQPYHALEGQPLPQAARRLARYQAAAARLARTGLRQVLAALEKQGYAPRAAGILASSGRQGSSLAAILAAHPLIHTADGEHFRDALAFAGRQHGVRVARIREKDLVEQAAKALGRSAPALQAAVAAWGKPLGPPWTQDQKLSALGGWLGLALPPASYS